MSFVLCSYSHSAICEPETANQSMHTPCLGYKYWSSGVALNGAETSMMLIFRFWLESFLVYGTFANMLASNAYGFACLLERAHALSVAHAVDCPHVASALFPFAATAWPLPLVAAAALPAAAPPPLARPPLPLLEALPLALLGLLLAGLLRPP